MFHTLTKQNIHFDESLLVCIMRRKSDPAHLCSNQISFCNISYLQNKIMFNIQLNKSSC